jgi:hypothetical protein
MKGRWSKHMSNVTDWLRHASKDLSAAAVALDGEAAAEAPGELLFSRADLEAALRDLGYAEARKIAVRITRSLTPQGLYTRDELVAAYGEVFPGGGSTTVDKTIEQARKNRLDRLHKEA